MSRDNIRGGALRTLSVLHRPVGSAALSLKVRSGAPLRLNIGAGRSRLADWINADIHWRSEVYLDLLKPWPKSLAGQVTHVFADNVIEHFTIEDARTLLRYAYDALRPGGVIRLATPDVEATARAYLDDPELAAKHLARHRDAGYRVYYPVDLLRVVFAESGHHLGYCYDQAALAAELAAAGFRGIKRCNAGQSDEPDFVSLELRTSPSDIAMTLVLEARRPG